MSEAPKSVNGYAVVQALATNGHGFARGGHVILVDKGEGHHRWVTAWIAEGDQGWSWGHYFLVEADARADFASRCRRGY